MWAMIKNSNKQLDMDTLRIIEYISGYSTHQISYVKTITGCKNRRGSNIIATVCTVCENGQWKVDITKNFTNCIKTLILRLLSNLKGYNGLGTFNDYPWTVSQRKPLEQRSPADDQLESPAKVVRMQYRKMLSVYSDTNEIGN
jgi:hypothetical protein